MLRGRGDPTIELQKALADHVGAGFPGKAVLDSWRGADVSLGPLDKAVSEAIVLMRSGAHVEPRRLWEVGLRLFEKLQQSNFRKVLTPPLAEWMREQWRRIVANESFRLSRPMQSVPAIEAVLANTKNTEALIASLLLVTSEAVGSPLAAEYERRLKDTATDKS